MASQIIARHFARAAAPRFMLRATRPAAVQRSAFSTTQPALNGKPAAEASGNPELPKFSLKHLSANPRTRFWIGASIFVLGCIEGATWVKFWPKITGKKEEVSESS
ncbi:putative rep helicase protein [Phaeoacremonium minimum UCRPA7]|uniref:Putative rep helicase protein n=1 Tax=Phaeoacremonium minimum (strain UCR-PA7) TaxID=1286976 RepID=R8BKE7_PHAM7|nr:putative rep helicase protein [Phaeoacremonium minimum UCRPA7]EON99791.1 putative rep helicase protein [Phaeoacremonium minimum UCRPA7]